MNGFHAQDCMPGPELWQRETTRTQHAQQENSGGERAHGVGARVPLRRIHQLSVKSGEGGG